jgi:diketogulonate reductase-like aldo/keto reductase
MICETISNLQMPKIGFGTWKVGGREVPDPTDDQSALAALRSALELGYTHFDTAERYAASHAEELLGRAIREVGVQREKLFITSKVNPEHLAHADVLTAYAGSQRRRGMDYLDLYLIHWPMVGMNLEETFRALNHLVREGRILRLGVSNFDLALLKEAATLSDTPLLSDQVPYSLANRTYSENGVLAYCQQNDILLTAYSPVKRGSIHNNPACLAISAAHGATPEQIALSWLTTQPRVITIPLSFNPQHQKENLAAGDIILSEIEMSKLEGRLPV